MDLWKSSQPHEQKTVGRVGSAKKLANGIKIIKENLHKVVRGQFTARKLHDMGKKSVLLLNEVVSEMGSLYMLHVRIKRREYSCDQDTLEEM